MSTRRIDPRPPQPVHRCRLPWWCPLRRTGTRVQCTECGQTWRWDHDDSYAGYDAGRQWINEGEEAAQAATAAEAKRNR